MGLQVKQNTDMESHEEKLHKMLIQSKINDTKDVMKRKAMEIDKQKLDREAKTREAKVAGYAPSIGSGPSSLGPSAMDSNTPTYSKCASPSHSLAHDHVAAVSCQHGKCCVRSSSGYVLQHSMT